jgi:glyoxylase-like metal-dependent hydrolase (beta-lactamase superfamily II)
MMKRYLAVAAGLALLAAGSVFAQQPAQPPVREITKIAGEVYRFRNNNHYAVFAVTPAGVIVTDPIDAGAAQWLKAEIKQRFNQPVRYVIYSHDHADHISGGQVFTDTALVVAHDSAKAAIIAEKRPTAVPDITFSEDMIIELGGTLVQLSYVGKNHSDNSIVVRFPRERILFAVDFIPVETLAFRDFPDGYINDWVDSLGRVEAMDFDILAPGHGSLGKKAHVTMFREYMQDLRGEVLRHLREGKSLDETKQLVKLTKYEKWTNYQQWLPLNVEGMYRYLAVYRRPN